MIRRHASSAGESPEWLLVDQAEHARLAGQIAEAWGREPFAQLDPRGELLAAIYHHDDGWRRWDAAPDAEPAAGRPRQFTEMPLHESLRIWRDSIDAAAGFGSLAAYVVAGHFCTLLRRFRAWRSGEPEQQRLGREFLREFDQRMAGWFKVWQETAPRTHTPELAARGVFALQFFDNLSLWFCCAERHEPQTFLPRGGPHVTFVPAGPETLVARPWPFIPAELELEVPARRVPAVAYPDQAALAAAPSRPEVLRWKLRPEN